MISDIKKAIEELEQPTIFEKDYSPLIKACRAFLEKQEYKTVRCYYTYKNIKKSGDLIELFDALMTRHHPDLVAPYRRKSVDGAIAKRFVESRMSSGDKTKKQALSECAEIISTVFKHESEFNFNMPLTFSVFGQANCGWITDKAIQIMNKKKAKEDELRAEVAQEACLNYYIEKHGEDSIGFDIDKIIKNMGEHNGKEKEKGKSSA